MMGMKQSWGTGAPRAALPMPRLLLCTTHPLSNMLLPTLGFRHRHLLAWRWSLHSLNKEEMRRSGHSWTAWIKVWPAALSLALFTAPLCMAFCQHQGLPGIKAGPARVPLTLPGVSRPWLNAHISIPLLSITQELNSTSIFPCICKLPFTFSQTKFLLGMDAGSW